MMRMNEELITRSAIKLLAILSDRSSTRKQTLHLLERGIRRRISKRRGQRPDSVLNDQFFMSRNMIWSIDRVFRQGHLSRETFYKFAVLLANIWFQGRKRRQEFEQRYGFPPPRFITISPTKRCNLNCIGCYANSSHTASDTLDYEIVSRVIREKTQLWGSNFTVISGGEPLLYRSQGKDIFDLVSEHSDNLFLMYTNGTLINKANADRFAEVGNLTPAISVEGFETETDARRGKGTHARILAAFERLREVGVPYGISITATRHNADLVVSDEFMEYYIDQMGASYVWIFQYMPIGRSYTLEMMVTPEQRVAMWRKERELINKRGLFIADFWNCGTVSNGCISAGKENSGYLYIDWNGNVMPCVFNPYYTHNIIQIYEEGGDLNTALMAPMMETIRRWHRSYVLHRPPDRVGNMLCQCAIRDHYRMMRRIIKLHGAKPEDEAAAEALEDPEYYRGMVAYGERLRVLTDPIWKSEYLQDSTRAADD